MKIICISDTHNQHENLIVPDGDMLIHAGDITSTGEHEDLIKFNDWLGRLPHKYKIVIAGNHDFYGETHPEEMPKILSNAIYLNDSGVAIDGFNIWGSPISSNVQDYWAFSRNRGNDIRKHWDLIPSNIDILITHSPPFGILDSYMKKHEGCEDLLEIIQARVKPRLHVFGHIHDSYGQLQVTDNQYVNASIVGLNNWVGNSPFLKWFYKRAISVYQVVKFIRKNIFKIPADKLTPKSLAEFSWRVINPAIIVEL